jgi:hypothetical protein
VRCAKALLELSLARGKPLCQPDCGSVSELEKGGERELNISVLLVDQKESAILAPLKMTLFEESSFVVRVNFVYPWVTWIRRRNSFC